MYAKRPFAGPAQVLHYLGRHTHRVALSNDRLVDQHHGRVWLRWRDYAEAGRGAVAILNRDETSDWLKMLVLAASLGGFVGALELWFFEFSLNRLLAAVAAGAAFGVVFVSVMRISPVANPTRSLGVLYSVPSGLAGGVAYWLVAVPETSIWVALVTGVALGALMVLAEW